MDDTIVLVSRAQAGQQEAVEALFARYLPRLQRWARGRLPLWARDLTDTHDLVQDTLLRTFRNIEGFEYRSEGAFLAYLRQALMNRIREEIRRRSRRPENTTLETDYTDSAPSPLEQTIGKERFERYERALNQLGSDQKEAIIGRLEMGLAYDELALLQQKPSADAARKSVERAIARLIEVMNLE